MILAEGTAFKAEGIAIAESLSQEDAWKVQEMAGKPVARVNGQKGERYRQLDVKGYTLYGPLWRLVLLL